MVGCRCVVPGCGARSTRNKDRSFFGFPRDEPRRATWIERTQVSEDINIDSTSFAVCSAHFESKYIFKHSNHRNLSSTAVPTLFPLSDSTHPLPVRCSMSTSAPTSLRLPPTHYVRKRNPPSFENVTNKIHPPAAKRKIIISRPPPQKYIHLSVDGVAKIIARKEAEHMNVSIPSVPPVPKIRFVPQVAFQPVAKENNSLARQAEITERCRALKIRSKRKRSGRFKSDDHAYSIRGGETPPGKREKYQKQLAKLKKLHTTSKKELRSSRVTVRRQRVKIEKLQSLNNALQKRIGEMASEFLQKNFSSPMRNLLRRKLKKEKRGKKEDFDQDEAYPDEKEFALILNFYSPKAYKYLLVNKIFKK